MTLLRMLFSRRPALDTYCVTCDGFHPLGAVLYHGQYLCHAAAGKSLPFVAGRQPVARRPVKS